MQQSAIAEVLLDPIKFSKAFLWVKSKPDKSGIPKLMPLTFNKMQMHYHQNRTHRDIIVKARQMGMSTGILALNFHRCITIPNTEAAVVTHKDEASDYLMEIIRRFHSNLPMDMPTDKNNEDGITFVFTDQQNKKQTSSMLVGTAGGKIFGRAYSFSLAHLTEVAHWDEEKVKTILAGVVNAIPDSGFITQESTPNGRSGYFFTEYQAAKSKDSPYKPFFYPWWWSDDYYLDLNSSLLNESDLNPKLSEEETYLARQFNLNFTQILWRRWKFKELDRVRKDLFRQEFPENDVDCWLVSELMVFDAMSLHRLIQNKLEPLSTDDFTTIWKYPQGSIPYVIGVDVAEGYETGDYSVAAVLNAHNYDHVATLRGHLPVDIFTDKLMKLGKQYNEACIAVERNMGHGVIQLLKKSIYPNIYYSTDSSDSTALGRAGIQMSPTNRKMVIDWFKSLVNSGTFNTSDEVLINEALDFLVRHITDARPTGRPDHAYGKHDDTLFAAMIACIVREQIPLEYYNPITSMQPSSFSYID